MSLLTPSSPPAEHRARPAMSTRSTGAAVRSLAWLEARRLLRHPAVWLGVAISVLSARDALDDPWSGAGYHGLVSAVTATLLGISLASAGTFARGRVPVADDAPLSAAARNTARLLAGLALVALVAALVAGTAIWLRLRGGLGLGDPPGHTEHAHYSLPELAQPVILAGFAVVLGAVTARVVRQRFAAGILVFVFWFLVGTAYWVFNAGVARRLTPVQVQPVQVRVGSRDLDPATFPADWLLAAPGQYQDHWGRYVVSPTLAAWHDVYLLGLIGLGVAAVVAWRHRRLLAVAAALVAVGAVLLQSAATPASPTPVAAGDPAATLPPAPAKSADAVPVVVDTDLGGDDLAALAFLLRHPRVRVEAVTVAATGLVGCEPGRRILAGLFTALRTDAPEVACGRDSAGPNGRAMPREWRDQAAAGIGVVPGTTPVATDPTGAAALITRTASRVDGLVVVGLGPLTNVADAAERDPAGYARIARLHALAGAVDEPSLDGVAEWNAAADPAALSRVLAGAGVRDDAGDRDGPEVVLVPVDAVPSGTPVALRAPVVSRIVAAVQYPRWWDLAAAAALVTPFPDQSQDGVERAGWSLDPTDPGRLRRDGIGAVRVIRALDPTALEAEYALAFPPAR